jgi:hypothetical protein
MSQGGSFGRPGTLRHRAVRLPRIQFQMLCTVTYTQIPGVKHAPTLN